MTEEDQAAENLRREAIIVAKKLHAVMRRIEFTDGSVGGTLGGILLYTTILSRDIGMPVSVLHLMIDMMALEAPPPSRPDLVESLLAANLRMDQIILEAEKEIR